MMGLFADLPRRALRTAWRIFAPRLPRVALLSDNADWALDHVAGHLHAGVEALVPGLSGRVARLDGGGPAVVHFVSQYSVASAPADLPARCLATTSFMHGRLDEHPDDRAIVATLRDRADLFPKIVVTTGIMAKALAERGIDPARIVRIPLGVDLRTFTPVDASTKATIRDRLGIPPDVFAVGSFQKDGDGWGEGDAPKLIKGPDVFCDALVRAKKDLPVFAVLTGPARGYVKKRLDAAGIRYVHAFLKNKDDVIDYYRALDTYLVASRVEGGPLSIVESWATGTPLITTNMGMAPDIAVDEHNALVRDVDDAAGLAEALLRVASDSTLRANIVAGGKVSVAPHHWPRLAERHLREVYAPTLTLLGLDPGLR
ncbi:MAG: glycosyltransferase family 4 protein [Proteobacteria bacterium]|nr:glycosyltransferase family 4 protein [Pseudomonadota bacterium]